ncbi:hypothetical protein LUZ60_015969 [Juncus effusus]|nr:hypothetical protein LUZ60_015969 [Juncus effusus]
MSSAEMEVIKRENSPEDSCKTYKRRRSLRNDNDSSELSTDTTFCKSDPEKEQNYSVDKHWLSWRKILQIQLNSLREGGGIENCIEAALDTCPYTLIGKSQENECMNESILNNSIKACEGNNTTRCQNTLLDVLVSEKFAFLCDLLVTNFKEQDFMKFINLSLIHVRMKNGQYERSPDLFIRDINKMWEKFQKIGQEIVRLTNNLSSVAKDSTQKKVGGEVEFESEEKYEKTCILNTETCICFLDPIRRDHNNNINQNNNNNNYINNSEDSTTVQQQLTLTLTQSDRSSHPETLIYPICKICGLNGSNLCSLICDKCESTYHFSCIQPPLVQIPTQTWFCNSCQITKMPSEPKTNKKQKTKKPKSSHADCAVCKELVKAKITEIPLEKEEIKIQEVINVVDPPKLCKICKCEEELDKKILICGHSFCPYKYYHIRCLKDSQIASKEQINRPCWYCPSCLCRKCYLDENDENIVLCDSCDEAYHLNCMEPVRETVPSGNWFCLECNLERAKRGMRIYEETVLNQHWKQN